VTLVELGSFTLAAKKLNIPKSKLSRRIAQFELKLGNELLIRTTRSQQLTESGRLLYCRCKTHIEALSKVEEDVFSLVNEPQGKLHILLPLEFFNNVISSLVTDFIKIYPKIELNCQHYSGVIPEYDHHYDLSFVLHEQQLPSSNWVAKTLLSFPQSIYVAKFFDTNLVKTPEDLQTQECVLAEENQPWLFRDKELVQAVSVYGRVTLSSPEMRLQATQEKLGICKLPDYVLQTMKNRPLVKALKLTKQPVAQQLSVLYQSRNISVKTRTFLDFFQSNLGRLL
jgi:DNA-binding transcriptional LysR family regulator